MDDEERGPIPAIHSVVRWRLIDLVQWLHDEFAVSLKETNVSRELKKLGYVKLTARPRHHAQNEHAMEAFKKGGFAAELAYIFGAICPELGKGAGLVLPFCNTE